MNRLPDHAIGPIGEVFLKLLGEREILRPQRLVMKLPWRESLNGTRPLTLLSIGLQSISTTEFEEEFALPRVVQTADHDDIQPLGTLSSQTGSGELQGKARGFSLAITVGAGVQRLDQSAASSIASAAVAHPGDRRGEADRRRTPQDQKAIKTPLAEGLR